MGDGPRDWNPPGYWDSTRSVSPKQSNWRQVRAPKSRRTAIVLASIAILLGLFACWWPLSLPSANGGYRGFAFTTLGLTAAALAYRALQFRGWTPRISKALPFTGFSLGLIGTVLCIWSLASFYAPQVVPALPSFNPSATGQSLTSPYPPIALAPGAASSRVVAPIDGADIAAPAQQLHANLKHVAISLASGFSYIPGVAWVPDEVAVQPDGLVVSANATYSRLPSYMQMRFTPAGDRQNFTLVISDTLSPMSVSYDSRTRLFTDSAG